MQNKTEECCTCHYVIADSNRGPEGWCLSCWDEWLSGYEADQAAEAERLRKQILDFVGKL